MEATQLNQLKKVTRVLAESYRVVQVGEGGPLQLSLPMRSNDVLLLTLEQIKK